MGKGGIFCPIPLLPAQKWYLFWPTGFFGVGWGGDFFLSFSDSGPNIDSVRIANWIAFRPFLSGIKILFDEPVFSVGTTKRKHLGCSGYQSPSKKENRDERSPRDTIFFSPSWKRGNLSLGKHWISCTCSMAWHGAVPKTNVHPCQRQKQPRSNEKMSGESFFNPFRATPSFSPVGVTAFFNGSFNSENLGKIYCSAGSNCRSKTLIHRVIIRPA